MPPMSLIRRTILETLSRRGPLPLDELARATRHSVMATRYHLGLLVKDDLVAANTVAHRAVVGRPQTLYALAERAHAHLPKQYETLAAQLLVEITRASGEKETRALLRRAGRRLAATAPPLRRGARLQTRLNRATDFLCARGYLAHWEKSDDAAILRICNCPYHQVTRAYHQVCDLDIALIGALLQSPLKMTHCLAAQNAQCVFVIKPGSASKK
jgi:predicted ArsR family transcriptional regulator